MNAYMIDCSFQRVILLLTTKFFVIPEVVVKMLVAG